MQKSKKQTKWWHVPLAALFWVAVWQVASLAIGQELLLPSPLSVLRSLVSLATTGLFWQSVWFSLLRIALGFALGLVLGCLFAAGAAAASLIETLLSPLMQFVRATPVASVIILALMWFSSSSLSVFVALLIVLPVIYSGCLTGIRAADPELKQMAAVFRVGRWRRFRAILLPALRPSLLAACELGLGLCWKSGVAAEVIGLPRGSIGERLYQAKIFLQMPEMFAWTFVILIFSWLFARLVMLVLRRGTGALCGVALPSQGPVQAVTNKPENCINKVKISNLYKKYNEQTVLENVSLSVAPGERVALMGPSGVGKTTLVRLLLGLERPDGGSIETGGMPMGAVFQEDRLCPGLTAIENVALVLPKHSAADIPAAFAAVGLTAGDTTKPVHELSGGQKRRVALVRAAMAQNGALVLDEAFKGLDDSTRQTAYAYLLDTLDGRSMLVVTHDETEATALCEREMLL